MEELSEFLGWITAVAFGLAVLNYFIKYVNRKFINNVSKEDPSLAKNYRIIMRYFIRYHRLFGIIATVAVSIHFIVIYTTQGILSYTGIIAAIAMILVFSLGVFGTRIQKKINGGWVKIHRGISFILIIAIVVHLITKI